MWVLFDMSWLAHRARVALGGLSFEDAPTGVIFGVLEEIRSVCSDRRVASNKTALFFDSRQSYRRRDFPDYKRPRREAQRTPEEEAQRQAMHDQVRRLREEILPDIGFPCYRQTGLESDDLIASAVSSPLTRAVIVTSDGDLYQCIRWNVAWFDPGRNLMYLPGSFLAAKLVDPVVWADVKCLAGCKTDNVPGIPGIGEKSAIDYLTDILPIEHKRHQAITSAEGRAIAARNKTLICLPHAKTKPVALQEPAYRPERFHHWCHKLGMESLCAGARGAQWEAFFAGNMKFRGEDRVQAAARRRGP